MSDLQLLDDLRRARQRISDPRRWTKGTLGMFMYEWGGVCAMGAAYYGVGVGYGITLHEDALQARVGAVAHELAAAIGVSDAGRIVIFNDHPFTRHEHVLAMFDKAIASVEARLAPTITFDFTPEPERELVNA